MFIPEDYTKVIMVTLPSKLKVSKYIASHFLCIVSLEPEIERLNSCRSAHTTLCQSTKSIDMIVTALKFLMQTT